MKTWPLALTIAGSDSGGGAGLQADLKTFSALGVYGMSVVTALTAQNTVEVRAIHPVPADFVRAQLRAVFEDLGADAVKIGMLFDPAVIEAVAEELDRFRPRWIVLDPVMVAKSGDRLLREDAVLAMRRHLIPRAHLITPNLPEAAALLGRNLETRDRVPGAAADLLKFGSRAVLLKGGHLPGETCADWLVGEGIAGRWLESPRVESRNTHGTGCTLSSAIAAFLARGLPLGDAVNRAKSYLDGALAAGADLRWGHGHGPVLHFAEFWGLGESS